MTPNGVRQALDVEGRGPVPIPVSNLPRRDILGCDAGKAVGNRADPCVVEQQGRSIIASDSPCLRPNSRSLAICRQNIGRWLANQSIAAFFAARSAFESALAKAQRSRGKAFGRGRADICHQRGMSVLSVSYPRSYPN